MDTMNRRLSPAQFFDLALDGGSMTAAHLATGIAYSTVHRAGKGGGISVDTAKALSKWSKGVPAAAAAGVYIDAAVALGLDPDSEPANDPRPSSTPPSPAVAKAA
jgi:hypothetical protein